jgi:TRAP-type C4-dicarboxylate transport system permease small subunit
MSFFADLLRRITRGGSIAGGIFLTMGMLLLVGNILGRFVHFILPGSYELFEMTMTIPIAFALVYAALHSTHVTVDLIVSRFPPKLGAATEIFANLMSLAIWTLIAYAAIQLANENRWREVSEILGIPYLPFRIVWILCLILFCVVYVQDLYRAIRRFLET